VEKQMMENPRIVSMAKATVMRLGLAAALLVVGAPLSLGRTLVAFGPENFVRSKGKPVTERRHFSLPNPGADYTLRIDNGGVNSEFRRVSSAVITLNGVEVVRPNDFNQNVAVIETSVTLLTENVLTVELRSAPGSGFTLQVKDASTSLETSFMIAIKPDRSAAAVNTAFSLEAVMAPEGIAPVELHWITDDGRTFTGEVISVSCQTARYKKS
jgi:hypothetical protein